MSRLLLVSGKGGVGKTTVAAATAVRAAEAGRRTLVVSVDRAHNLGDVLGARLGPSPTPVAGCPGLEAMEADAQDELQRHEAALHGYLARLLAWAGLSASQADEVAIIPGLEELLVLARLAALLEEARHEVLVVDLAPTASSLRLLSLPELLAGPVGRLARWERQLLRVARPAAARLWSAPLPEDGLYDSLELLAARLGQLRTLLLDPAQASVRLVCVPERVVVDETRSAFSLFSLFGLAVDAVVVNRVLPPELAGTPLGAWVGIQARELARAREAFGDLPLTCLPFQPEEVLGVPALSRLGALLHGDADPAAAAAGPPPVRFATDRPALSLALPHHRAAGELDLQQLGDELIITLGGWRRRLQLPPSLAGRPVAGATLSGGQLHVQFEEVPA